MSAVDQGIFVQAHFPGSPIIAPSYQVREPASAKLRLVLSRPL